MRIYLAIIGGFKVFITSVYRSRFPLNTYNQSEVSYWIINMMMIMMIPMVTSTS